MYMYITVYIYNTQIAPLQRGKTPPTSNEYRRYDTKESDGEIPVMLGL